MKKNPSAKKQKKEGRVPGDRVEQTHTTVSPSSKYTRAEDMFAAEKGDVSSMEELVRRAKEDDDEKSFMKLIENNTLTYLANRHEDSTLLHPWIDVDYDFYKQPWVQKKLEKGMLDQGRKGKLFREKFWKSAISNIETDHLRWAKQDEINNYVKSKRMKGGKKDKSELKRYVVMRKDRWNADLRLKRISFEEILRECENDRVVDADDYSSDIDSFRKFLNIYGVKGLRGRDKKRK